MVARRVLGEIPEIPIGLGVFAGSAHLLLPPTADRALLLSTLDAADPSILSERGTRLASALEAVRAKQEEALGQGGFGVLILSDGEDHGGRDEALSLAREIQALGGWVAAVSLGSRSGGPVPSLPASPGMLMSGLGPAEAGGDRPQSRADPEFLAEVARSGGGVFASGDSPEEVKALLAYLGEWGAVEATGVKMEEVPLEAWPLFLALALAGLFLEGALDHWSLRRYASSWR